MQSFIALSPNALDAETTKRERHARLRRLQAVRKAESERGRTLRERVRRASKTERAAACALARDEMKRLAMKDVSNIEQEIQTSTAAIGQAHLSASVMNHMLYRSVLQEKKALILHEDKAQSRGCKALALESHKLIEQQRIHKDQPLANRAHAFAMERNLVAQLAQQNQKHGPPPAPHTLLKSASNKHHFKTELSRHSSLPVFSATRFHQTVPQRCRVSAFDEARREREFKKQQEIQQTQKKLERDQRASKRGERATLQMKDDQQLITMQSELRDAVIIERKHCLERSRLRAAQDEAMKMHRSDGVMMDQRMLNKVFENSLPDIKCIQAQHDKQQNANQQNHNVSRNHCMRNKHSTQTWGVSMATHRLQSNIDAIQSDNAFSVDDTTDRDRAVAAYSAPQSLNLNEDKKSSSLVRKQCVDDGEDIDGVCINASLSTDNNQSAVVSARWCDKLFQDMHDEHKIQTSYDEDSHHTSIVPLVSSENESAPQAVQDKRIDDDDDDDDDDDVQLQQQQQQTNLELQQSMHDNDFVKVSDKRKKQVEVDSAIIEIPNKSERDSLKVNLLKHHKKKIIPPKSDAQKPQQTWQEFGEQRAKLLQAQASSSSSSSLSSSSSSSSSSSVMVDTSSKLLSAINSPRHAQTVDSALAALRVTDIDLDVLDKQAQELLEMHIPTTPELRALHEAETESNTCVSSPTQFSLDDLNDALSGRSLTAAIDDTLSLFNSPNLNDTFDEDPMRIITNQAKKINKLQAFLSAAAPVAVAHEQASAVDVGVALTHRDIKDNDDDGDDDDDGNDDDDGDDDDGDDDDGDDEDIKSITATLQDRFMSNRRLVHRVSQRRKSHNHRTQSSEKGLDRRARAMKYDEAHRRRRAIIKRKVEKQKSEKI